MDDSIRLLMDERDRRYEQRFQAQEQALKLAVEVQQQAYSNTLKMVGLLIIVVQIVLHLVR